MDKENHSPVDAMDGKRRRSSILKPVKTRNPLLESDQLDETEKQTRKVRFSSNFVKPFTTEEYTTIWDRTYEEPIEASEDTPSTSGGTNMCESAANDTTKQNQNLNQTWKKECLLFAEIENDSMDGQGELLNISDYYAGRVEEKENIKITSLNRKEKLDLTLTGEHVSIKKAETVKSVCLSKTVFDQTGMEITQAVPISAIHENLDQHQQAANEVSLYIPVLDDKEGGKTATILPSEEVDEEVHHQNERRMTIYIPSDMELTKAAPTDENDIQSYENSSHGGRKTITIPSDMEMTEAVPSDILQTANYNLMQPTETPAEVTIFPLGEKLNEAKNVRVNDNSKPRLAVDNKIVLSDKSVIEPQVGRRKTILIPTDMELTEAIPVDILEDNDCSILLPKDVDKNKGKRKTILIYEDMDITEAVSSSILVNNQQNLMDIEHVKSLPENQQQSSSCGRRKTILIPSDMELTEAVPVNVMEDFLESSSQPPLAPSDHIKGRRKTILIPQDMEFTEVIPAGILENNRESQLSFSDENVDSSKGRRKTILIPADMELTKGNNDDHQLHSPESKDKRKTILISQDMEITEVVPTNILENYVEQNSHLSTKNDDDVVTTSRNKRKTILIPADMELTEAVPIEITDSYYQPHSSELKDKDHQKEKRKTILIHQDMEITEAVPMGITDSYNQPHSSEPKDKARQKENRKTILIPQDMEMTEAVPIEITDSYHQSNSLETKDKDHQKEKRKTILIPADMELTEAVPIEITDSYHQPHSSKPKDKGRQKENRKTILIPQDMEMTEAVPIGITDSYHQSHSSESKVKRKTILIHQDMEITEAVPANVLDNYEEPNKQLTKTGDAASKSRDRRNTTLMPADMELKEAVSKSVLESCAENGPSDEGKEKTPFLFECDLGMTGVFPIDDLENTLVDVPDNSQKLTSSKICKSKANISEEHLKSKPKTLPCDKNTSLTCEDRNNQGQKHSSIDEEALVDIRNHNVQNEIQCEEVKPVVLKKPKLTILSNILISNPHQKDNYVGMEREGSTSMQNRKQCIIKPAITAKNQTTGVQSKEKEFTDVDVIETKAKRAVKNPRLKTKESEDEIIPRKLIKADISNQNRDVHLIPKFNQQFENEDGNQFLEESETSRIIRESMADLPEARNLHQSLQAGQKHNILEETITTKMTKEWNNIESSHIASKNKMLIKDTIKTNESTLKHSSSTNESYSLNRRKNKSSEESRTTHQKEQENFENKNDEELIESETSRIIRESMVDLPEARNLHQSIQLSESRTRAIITEPLVGKNECILEESLSNVVGVPKKGLIFKNKELVTPNISLLRPETSIYSPCVDDTQALINYDLSGKKTAKSNFSKILAGDYHDVSLPRVQNFPLGLQTNSFKIFSDESEILSEKSVHIDHPQTDKENLSGLKQMEIEEDNDVETKCNEEELMEENQGVYKEMKRCDKDELTQKSSYGLETDENSVGFRQNLLQTENLPINNGGNNVDKNYIIKQNEDVIDYHNNERKNEVMVENPMTITPNITVSPAITETESEENISNTSQTLNNLIGISNVTDHYVLQDNISIQLLSDVSNEINSPNTTEPESVQLNYAEMDTNELIQHAPDDWDVDLLKELEVDGFSETKKQFLEDCDEFKAKCNELRIIQKNVIRQVEEILNWTLVYDKPKSAFGMGIGLVSDHSLDIKSINEKVEHQAKLCDNAYKIVSVEGDVYTVMTLYDTVVLVVTVGDQDKGFVKNMDVYSVISNDSEVIAKYINSLFMEKLKDTNIKSSVGEYYTILTLLDYIRMNFRCLDDFDTDLVMLQLQYGIKMQPDFKIVYLGASHRLKTVAEVVINCLDYNKVDDSCISVNIKIGDIDGRSIKTIANNCTKGLPFLRSFIEKIDEYFSNK